MKACSIRAASAVRLRCADVVHAVADSPDIYRVVFLGEGGGNEVVAARIARGMERQAHLASTITRRWVEGLADLEGEEAEAVAQLLSQTIVGIAQVGARTLLRDPEHWTPATLAEKLGRMVWAARAAI